MENEIIYETPDILGAFDMPETLEEKEFAGKIEKNILMIARKLPYMGNYTIQANQNRKSDHYYWCTGYSTAGVLGDHYGWIREHYEEFTDETSKIAIQKGQYDIKGGAYTANSGKTTEELFNKLNPSNKVRLVRVKIGSSLFWTLATRGYSFAMTYISSQGYVNDAADGKLDSVDFSNARGGHSIRWKNPDATKKTMFPNKFVALDNYFKNKNKPDEGFKRYDISRSLVLGLTGEPYFENCYTFIEERFFD